MNHQNKLIAKAVIVAMANWNYCALPRSLQNKGDGGLDHVSPLFLSETGHLQSHTHFLGLANETSEILSRQSN